MFGNEAGVAAFLHAAGERGVRFSLSQGRLRSIGAERLTAEEAGFVRQHKSAIIAHLVPTAAVVVPEEVDDGPAPLSHQQERLWLLHEIAERSEEYNSVTLLSVPAPLDADRFAAALRRVVRENDVLHTVFEPDGDRMMSVRVDAEPYFRHVPVTATALDTARALEEEEANHQFDLRAEVPVRCGLVTGPDESYVVLNIHHIACDGWSASLILDRLAHYYDDPDAALDREPVRCHRSYARWQRAHLTGDVLEALVDRWQARLDGAPLTHALPADLQPAHAERQGDNVVRHQVGHATYAAFQRLCARAGATEFAGLHAVLGMLLAVVSGQDETIVGSPIANREQREFARTVGFFVNMISVRGAVRPADTFRDVLAVKTAEIEFGYAHQQAPFERVVERLAGPRRENSTPVFQIVLALQNMAAARPRFGGVPSRELPEVPQHSRFDLEVFVHGVGEQDRVLEWMFNSRRFERESVRRWAGWFADLLAEATEHPDTPLSDLRVFAPPAHDRSAATPPVPVDVLARLRAVVAADPHRVAVSDGTQVLSYADLLAHAERIGAALIERYGRGAVVGIGVDRSTEFVKALVGVLCAGATYVVLDPEDTAPRRAAVLAASRPQCVLTARAADLSDMDNAVPIAELLPESPHATAPAPHPDQDLYHVFTSGSTGRPKGVRISYGNLAGYLGGVLPRLGLTDGLTYCWHSSVATDFGNTVVFGALATGGRLEIATRDDILDGAAMHSFLHERRVDVLKITPSHLEALLATHPLAELLPARMLVLGGEAASPALARALWDAPETVRLFNHYGPSETTVGVLVAELGHGPDARGVPIGSPLPGVEATIESAPGRPAPAGVVGELVLRGAQVGHGYLDGETGVFGWDGAERTYRTGDWVRQRNDGQVLFVGRRDDQIKIRGHRVEPGEVKAALERVPGVRRSEVLVVTGDDGPSLVGFVQHGPAEPAGRPVAAADVRATVEQWREFYDYAYRERVSGDIEFNTSGWISSYTGERLPDEQMRVWLDLILSRVRALRPRRVLEIGCGLGIIAYPLSREVERYLACDLSAEIVAANRANAARIDAGDLTFFTCEALDIDAHADQVRAAGCDTVVINSVVQYFPDADYLDAVLDKVLAMDCVRHVVVGDVRNLDLLDEFSLSLIDARHPDVRSGLARLQLARTESERASELLVSDRYWYDFAATRGSVRGVSVLPRVTDHANELLDFRYDVVLSKESSALRVIPADAAEGGPADADVLCEALTAGTTDAVVLRDVPNPRTVGHCAELRAVRSGVAGATALGPARRRGQGAELAAVRAAAERHGHQLSVHYARDDRGDLSRLSVVVLPGGGTGLVDSRAFGSLAGPDGPAVSTPAGAGGRRTLADTVAEELARTLPAQLRPARIVEVPAFPLNRTGKIDTGALLDFVPRAEHNEPAGELATVTEKRLAGLLAELLPPGTAISRDSDFFQIGGHSLLATRYVHAINQAFGLALRVKAVFDLPVLREFAELVAAGRPHTTTQATPRRDMLPLSPLQRRFWLVAAGAGPSTVYNSTSLLELTGPLDADALTAAYADVVAHHRVLAGQVHVAGDETTLRLRDADDLVLARVDLPRAGRAGAERYLLERLNRPFALETGPLLDAALIRSAPDLHHLALVVHHAIYDGASEDLLTADLARAYADRIAGRDWTPDHDGDGFLRHLATVAEPAPSDVDFWVRHLRGAPVMHDIPLDHERPDRDEDAGAVLHAALAEETTRLLTDLAVRSRTTAFVVLNTVVALYVSFLSGEDDVVIGSPVDCRTTEDDHRALGMYVNTVAFRHRLDWHRALDELVADTRSLFHDAVDHLGVPFDQVVAELNPPRLPGVNPLFQVMLALQPAGSEHGPFHDCTIRTVKPAITRAKFDLTLNSKIVDGRLHVHWEYRRALFEAGRIARMAELFETFVRVVAGDTARPLAEHRFSAAAAADRAVLTGPVVPLPHETYLAAFDRHLADDPAAVALTTADGTDLSRGTLSARSDALAALLAERGVRAGDLVAITLVRSAESIVAAMAVNRLGAAYVPLDAEHLRRDAAELTSVNGIRHAVVEDEGTDLGSVITVRRSEILSSVADTPVPRPRVGGDDLCYVIFTSGSTGRPKGVAVPHRSVANYLTHCATTYLGHRPTTALMSGPLSFDATVTTTLLALFAGVTMRIVPEGRELAGVRQALTADAGERLLVKVTPSHLVALANLGATDEIRTDRHTLVVGGEELTGGVAGPWYRAYPNGSVFNEYGPTETTVGCTWHEVTEADTRPGTVQIGPPICNTTIAVVGRGDVCLADQRGEIVILGEALARGYLDPEQTAAAFRPVPALDGALGYHSRDLATRAGDTLHYHGRVTREVKVRGLRINLPDVEAAIGALDTVADCACVVSRDARRLVATVVLDAAVPRTSLAEAELRDRVRTRLPARLVPDTVRLVDALPLTANGKTDLARLRFEADSVADTVDTVALQDATADTSVTDRLRVVWREVLGVHGELPADVSFFALGGNSLTVTLLLRRLGEEFGAELTLDALYREPTLRGQATLLGADTGTPRARRPVESAAAGAEVDLTPAQRRIYLLERLGSGTDYVNGICFRFAAGVNADRLGATLAALVDRHPVLKARVVERADRLLLVPGTGVPGAAHVPAVVAGTDSAAMEAELARARDTALRVAGGPLFEAGRYTLPDGTLYLQLLVHHIVFDGWSERVLLEDLVHLHRGGDHGPAPAPFQAYAAHWATARADANTAWWIETLTGAPATHNLPTREVDRAARTGTAERLHRVHGGDVVTALNSVARRLGVTPFTLLHTALALTVCAVSHEDEVVIGVPTANRADSRFHGTVGLFMETLPLRTRVPGGTTTFAELAAATGTALHEAIGRPDFRIEAVLNACAPHRDGDRNPLYQIMLSHNDEGGEQLVLDGAPARRLHLPARVAKLDLIVDAKVIDGELHLYWESDRDLFDPTLVTSLVEEFDRWLNRGLADPNRALTELVAPAAPAGPDQTAPSAYERFTSAWDRRWDEVAYTEAGTALTAAALHGRVVAMADRLTGLGLGRQSVVATRSGAVLDHVVMMLTCSRIGATHVPLDTASPERRTRDMLDQCGADVLVLPPGEHLDGPPVLSTSGLADGTPVTPVRQSSSTALSHIMYTSGSTGRAKGVRIDNAALNSYVAGINAAYGIDGAAVAQCGNPAYDVFVEEIGLSILVGNRMAVLPPELRGDPAAFAEFVRAERIELLPLPTSYWAFLVGAMADADFAKLRDVRVCAIGGEDYPPAAARTWFERFPEQPRLYNVYGPTENGPVSTVVELRPDTPPSTLGGPLGDVRCEVRSRFGTPVPNGGRGELWLSGPQLFRGYVDGPTVAEYRTGDIVLRDPEHGLRYVERAGSMMKISGFRVEAGEYLAVVADLPGVTDARVAANPARTGVVIYATVDGRADEPAIAEAVAARVRESLPRYMRGYELRFCRDVPLTPNGKADFRELAERSWPAPAPVVTATPAVVGPVEEVREIWRHVLGADRVDDEAGFFDQGGSSLEMLQLLAGLEERFPGTFALIDLYDRPSIRHQARHVHERAAGARPGSAEPAESAARERLARKRRARRQNRSER